ncbi:MAG TPA: sulfotransferase, partial [Lysobacter sp.]|nr:sulfotransferase [Lysobacter sp.]
MAIAMDPRMQGLDAEQVARLHAAARAIRDGQLDEARRLIDGVRAAAPGHAEPMRLSGLLHGRRGERAQAREVLLRAASLHPRDALLLCDLGSAQSACGE